MPTRPQIVPQRVLADLDELARATAGERGADRLAWTAGWRRGRDLLRTRLAELGLTAIEDEAGNLWSTLAGRREEMLVIGSHLDSVPEGGPLDGALGVLAGLEVMRALVEADSYPELTVALVDWADEEGARFGHSLFGSSAAAGTLDVEAARELRDSDGVRLEEALAGAGVELDRIEARPAPELERTEAYLELHIEQGPVLERERLAVAAVSGTVGVERFALGFEGKAAHAGSTPMDLRHDALLAAAETAFAVERIALDYEGLGTVGNLVAAPGVPTVIPGRVELTIDLRHGEGDELAAMRGEAVAAATAAAAGRGCTFTERPLWRTGPRSFDPELVELLRSACVDADRGRRRPLVSGALHDAAQVAPVAPAAMVFCPSIEGVSHAPEEWTRPEDLTAAIEVFGRVATRIALGAITLAGKKVPTEAALGGRPEQGGWK